MASTKEMQRRAAALKKASAFKVKQDNGRAKFLAELREKRGSAYVYLVYTNKITMAAESFSGVFEPYQQQEYSKDQTLASICIGLDKKIHHSAQPGPVMGAIADYLALSPAIMEGLQQGKQGVLMVLATEPDQTFSARVKVMPAAELHQNMTQEMALSLADGVDAVKI